MNPSATEQVQSILKQQNDLLVTKARLQAQLETVNSQLSALDGAVQGIQLGQALAAEVAQEASAKTD